MKQLAENILREYIQFDDVNQSETIELLALTIIDAMEEYAKQQQGYSEEEVYNIVQKAIEENNSKQLHFFDGGYSNPIYNNLNYVIEAEQYYNETFKNK